MSDNPYEAPRYDATLASLTYYQPLSTKLNLREYRRISKSSIELLLGLFFKFLRIRLRVSFAFADTGHFQRITPQQLSVRAREKMKPLADQALALNLKYAFSYWLPTVGTIEGVAAAFLSEDGRSFLLIVYARSWTQVMVDEKTSFAFSTRLANGTSIATAGSRGDLDTPPEILGESYPGKPMQEVFARHLERLGEVESPIVTVHDADALEQLLREYEKENFAFNLERGVYVPVSQSELVRLQRLAATTPETPRLRAKPPFRRIEFICWIVMILTLLMFIRDQPQNVSQLMFQLGILLAAFAGVTIIWLIRAVTWMQRKADE